MSRLLSRWKPAALAAVAIVVFAAPLAADPTEVTRIKGSKLHLFSEAGQRVGVIESDVIVTPTKIHDVSRRGMFKITVPGQGDVWIMKRQAETNADKPEAKVHCQEITKSYASTRGFGDCE